MKPMRFVLLACLAAMPALGQDFDACVKDLRTEAAANGITPQTLDAAFTGLQSDPSVLEAMDNQPEFETPGWEYLARLVDDKRNELIFHFYRLVSALRPRYFVMENVPGMMSVGGVNVADEASVADGIQAAVRRYGGAAGTGCPGCWTR